MHNLVPSGEKPASIVGLIALLEAQPGVVSIGMFVYKHGNARVTVRRLAPPRFTTSTAPTLGEALAEALADALGVTTPGGTR